MSVIAVLNPKGGCGKTTLSTNLAQCLYDRGKSVLVVDTDPQGSARDWQAVMDDNPLPLVALDRPNNLKSLKSVSATYDYVVIDGAAKLEDMMSAAIKAADFILIPVQASPYDLWAASDLVDFIKARQDVTDGVPLASFVITRAIQGTILGKEIRKALNEYQLGLFKTQVIQRQVYPQTAAAGKTVFNSTNTDAVDEINSLTDEILTYIKQENCNAINQ